MYKVLLVDDDALFRKTLLELVDWSAADLSVAGESSNGLEALDMIRSLHPDIVICDIKMPGIDGLHVLKNLSGADDLRFIILSGYNDFAFTRQAVMYGAFDFALKPLDEVELSGILLRAVESLNTESEKKKEALRRNLALRRSLTSQYESLFVHFVEIRDIDSLCEHVDLFFSRLDAVHHPDLLENTRTEFLMIADKICGVFRLNPDFLLEKRAISPARAAMDRPSERMDRPSERTGRPSEKSDRTTEKSADRQQERLATDIKEIFTDIVHRLITSKSSECGKIVDEVAEHIRNNFQEAISLESIAKRYFINPSHFSQVFKARTGESFSGFLIRVRLDKAKELLRLDKFRIYQISNMVGYGNEKHFCQIFRKYTGLSPSEYAKTAVGET